jgi:uncharacterized protein (TIGR04255 family)
MLTPRLQSPPIVEVVCGFFFQPIGGLDPIMVGKYWSERKQHAGYPKTQLHPPVADRAGVFFGDGVGPIRCWLIGEGDEYVLQIQPDRFYFNWRKRGGEYPHFNDYGGNTGVLTRSLLEFQEFSAFLRTSLGHAPKPSRLELAKIDLIGNPTHWSSYSDLRVVLPILGKLPSIGEEPAVNLFFGGEHDGCHLQLSVTNAVLGSEMSAAVQIETRVTAKDAGTEMRETFTKMNDLANKLFFETIAPDALGRFGGVTT